MSPKQAKQTTADLLLRTICHVVRALNEKNYCKNFSKSFFWYLTLPFLDMMNVKACNRLGAPKLLNDSVSAVFLDFYPDSYQDVSITWSLRQDRPVSKSPKNRVLFCCQLLHAIFPSMLAQRCHFDRNKQKSKWTEQTDGRTWWQGCKWKKIQIQFKALKQSSRTIHITRNCGENLSPLLEVRKGVQSPSHRLKPHPTPSQEECLGAWNQLNHVRAYPTSLSEELKISPLRGFMIAKTGL